MKKRISRIDIEPALNEIENINRGVAFLAAALPEYPHEGGMDELSTILTALSDKAQKAISEIKTKASLE